MAVVAAVIALSGGIKISARPDQGIVLLWTGFGIELALALLGLFSVGAIFLLAGMMMLLAISAGPNPTRGSWFGLKYIVPEIVSFSLTLAIVFH